MSSSSIIARMAAANVPADIIADVAMALARAEASEYVLEGRRAKDRARKAYPMIPQNSEEPLENCGTVGTPPALDKETSPRPPKEINLTPRARVTGARGFVLPEGWRPETLSRDTIAGQTIEKRGQEWTRRCFETFENHWRSKTGKDACKGNWQKTWANWIIEQDRRDGRQSGRSANDDGLGPNARASIAVFGPPH